MWNPGGIENVGSEGAAVPLMPVQVPLQIENKFRIVGGEIELAGPLFFGKSGVNPRIYFFETKFRIHLIPAGLILQFLQQFRICR